MTERKLAESMYFDGSRCCVGACSQAHKIQNMNESVTRLVQYEQHARERHADTNFRSYSAVLCCSTSLVAGYANTSFSLAFPVTKSTEPAADGLYWGSMVDDQPANFTPCTASLNHLLMQMRFLFDQQHVSGKGDANNLTCTLTTGCKDQKSAASQSLPPNSHKAQQSFQSTCLLYLVTAQTSAWHKFHKTKQNTFLFLI